MAVKQKWYAVRVGRDGPGIYDNWKETERAVKNFPKAQHKSFPTREQAQKYLDDHIPLKDTKVPEAEVLKRIHQHAHGTEEQPPMKKKRELSPSPSSQETTASTCKPTIYSPIPPPLSSETKQRLPSQPSSSGNKPSLPSAATAAAAPRPPPKFRQPDFSGLSADQARVFQRVLAGGSVFFTGSAGTGKSHLLRRMIDHYRNNTRKDVHVTASTGIAASLIKGTTLHSFVGLGLANEAEDTLYWKIIRQETVRKRWAEAELLIIDEVSMIEGQFFDKLNRLAKRVRCCAEPFGGIQLILTGDFLQLPPVAKSGPDARRVQYLFQSESWDECVAEIVVLKHVFRQSDPTFVDLLNELRMGVVSKETEKIMAAKKEEVKYNDEILPTELYPRKEDVAKANLTHLEKLEFPEVTFFARDARSPHCTTSKSEASRTLDKNTLAPHTLVLKEGAQVMLIKNFNKHKLVNGSIGIVTGFYVQEGEEGTAGGDQPNPCRLTTTRPFNNQGSAQKFWPKVRFPGGKTVLLEPKEFEYQNSKGEELATRHQVPLILAWALSIHKSQGQSLDRVKIDLARAFEAGQVYVALSRATSLHRLQVLGFHRSRVLVNKVVLEWAKDKSILN